MQKPKNSKQTFQKQDYIEIDRSIRALALPSLGTLLIEPLLIAVDSSMIGHLGTQQLAGLSLASTVLTTLVGLCIFLSYATTAATARAVGNNDLRNAARFGIAGIWLSLLLGVLFALFLFIFAPQILQIFSPHAEVLFHGKQYLQASAFGLPGMLLTLAITGALRGFSDAKTPLLATAFGALANIPLNFLFIYIFGFGISGAGFGTAIAQTGMGIFLFSRFNQIVAKEKIGLSLSGGDVLRSLKDSLPLIIRTISLRIALLAQISAATAFGTTALAANQIVMTMWNFAAYGLDALAIAAQILIAQALGAADTRRIALILKRCLSWGIYIGTLLTASFALLAFAIPQLISTDPQVQLLSRDTILLSALTLPLAAITYILDGVLIGAGDTRKLAKYMLISLLVFLPSSILLTLFSQQLIDLFAEINISDLNFGVIAGMLLLWAAYSILFMGARAITALLRVKGNAWMRIGKES